MAKKYYKFNTDDNFIGIPLENSGNQNELKTPHLD